MVETPDVDPEQARAYRDAGYRVEAVVVAEHLWPALHPLEPLEPLEPSLSAGPAAAR
ncbi:hypothetical protein [Streptomyces mirabilis]|uniref:hypothetical protein n=1 Tax=Streptomyces mirabilis TaxID=68239 RepID=UPI001604C997|nr:hypothetical protein [Streptomyces mirabilis]MCX4430330.1 hypothetical protein [Streptomyces mirabilis]